MNTGYYIAKPKKIRLTLITNESVAIEKPRGRKARSSGNRRNLLNVINQPYETKKDNSFTLLSTAFEVMSLHDSVTSGETRKTLFQLQRFKNTFLVHPFVSFQNYSTMSEQKFVCLSFCYNVQFITSLIDPRPSRYSLLRVNRTRLWQREFPLSSSLMTPPQRVFLNTSKDPSSSLLLRSDIPLLTRANVETAFTVISYT